ncbi:MAG: SUKH-3 domain-containing protein [Deinococcaceae bacterium]
MDTEGNRLIAQLQQEIEQELAEIQFLLKGQKIANRREVWPSLDETLYKSGWTANRCVDVSEIAHKLSSLGVYFNEFAIKFACSYNYLTVDFPGKNVNTQKRYKFDVLHAADHYVEFRLEEDECMIQRRLCPVGVDECGMVVLLIDDMGRVFASVDRKLNFVADSCKEALEKLNRSERFEQIEQ